MPYQVKRDFRQHQRWREHGKPMAGQRIIRYTLEDSGSHIGARNDRGHGKQLWQGQGKLALLALLREGLIDKTMQLPFR